MRFYPEQVYHIYNRGNNRQKIFFDEENYVFFLRKVRRQLLPHATMLCYCLMPNHFHFLIYTRADLVQDALNKAIGILLRSYTRAINLQEERTGSLFQQKTQAKPLSYVELDDGLVDLDFDAHYPVSCFHYIHQNPLVAGLVDRLENWPFSSFLDYVGFRDGTLCDRDLACELLDLPSDVEAFYHLSYQMIDPEKISRFL